MTGKLASGWFKPTAEAVGLAALAVPALGVLRDRNASRKERSHAKWELAGLGTLMAPTLRELQMDVLKPILKRAQVERAGRALAHSHIEGHQNFELAKQAGGLMGAVGSQLWKWKAPIGALGLGYGAYKALSIPKYFFSPGRGEEAGPRLRQVSGSQQLYGYPQITQPQ